MSSRYHAAVERFARAAAQVGKVEARGRPEGERQAATEEYAAAKREMEEAMKEQSEQLSLPDTIEKQKVGPGPAESEAILRDPRRRHQQPQRRKKHQG